MPRGVVRAFGILKQAAARNVALGQLDASVGDRSPPPPRRSSTKLGNHFPLRVADRAQSNMNANEVIANRAIEMAAACSAASRPCTPTTTSTERSSSDTFPVHRRG